MRIFPARPFIRCRSLHEFRSHDLGPGQHLKPFASSRLSPCAPYVAMPNSEIRTDLSNEQNREPELLSCGVLPDVGGLQVISFRYEVRGEATPRQQSRHFCVGETISTVGHRICQIVLGHEPGHMWTGIREAFQVSAKRRRPFQNCSHSSSHGDTDVLARGLGRDGRLGWARKK